MKKLLLCAAALTAVGVLSAQAPAPAPGRGMGMAKAPAASPAATETKTIAGKAITIAYSSPGVKGREGKIFTKDGLIGRDNNYPVWRAGANSATKFHTDADLQIGDLAVPKGDYTLYADISDPDNWILIVNKQVGQWGLTYDKAQDLGRVKMTMKKPAALIENLKYTVTEQGASRGTLELAWENHVASVPLTVK